jgi:myosin heavy subunit
VGSVVLLIALLGTIISSIFAGNQVGEAQKAKVETQQAQGETQRAKDEKQKVQSDKQNTDNQLLKAKKDLIRTKTESETVLKKAQEDITKSKVKIQQLKESERLATNKIEATESREKQAQANSQKLEEDVKNKDNELENKQGQVVKLNQQKQKLQSQSQKLQSEAKQLTQQKQQLESNAEELQKQADEFKKQADSEAQKVSQIQASKDKLDGDLQESQTKLGKSQEEIESKKAELAKSQEDLNQIKTKSQNLTEYSENLKQVAELAGTLQNEGANAVAQELFSQAGQSVKVENHTLRQDMLYTALSYGNQKLKKPDLPKSKDFLAKVQNNNDNTPESQQIQVLTLRTKANLAKEDSKNDEAKNQYQQALKILKDSKISPFDKSLKNKIVSKENVERIHRELIALLDNDSDINLKNQVKQSLKEHYYEELNNLLENKKWEDADRKTYQMMLFIADREKEEYLDVENIQQFSCPDFKQIDEYWAKNSNGHFGFKKQKEIWIETGNRLGIEIGEYTKKDEEAYIRFASRVGWYDEKDKDFLRYSQVIDTVNQADPTTKTDPKYRYTGILPTIGKTAPGPYLLFLLSHCAL